MKQGKLIGVGILSAFAASLCCITPILALIAGTSGAASAFSWIEPVRPYLVAITILILGFAWFRKLKPTKAETDTCGCARKKTSFFQSRLFLGIVTLFALLMLTLPYYSHLFYPDNQRQVTAPNLTNVSTVEFSISGMSCESCEQYIQHAITKLDGIVAVTVSYQTENALVDFDTTKISASEIRSAINATGYVVENQRMLK